MTDMLLQPAFGDAVADAQAVFRQALTAMSEPGAMVDVGARPALDVLHPATYALCLTLMDGDTPVWLSPSLDTPAVRANLAFHCACPVTSERAQAAFAILGAADAAASGFCAGNDRDPHISCTAIIQLDALDGGHATTWQGPGIADRRAVRLPVGPAFWTQRASQAFPRGLDYFFTAGQRMLALPRSTRVVRTVEGGV